MPDSIRYRLTAILSAAIFLSPWPAMAQSNAETRMYGQAAPFDSVDILPPGQLRSRLESLPEQARAKALHWLNSFSFTPEDLDYLRVDDEGGVLYADTYLPDQGGFASTGGDPVSQPAATTQAEVFSLHSRPGASRVVYLDFDGGVISGTAWNSSEGSTSWNAKAYDTDANPGSYSTQELANMHEIWHRVAEDFSAFDIDVTTENPGTLGPNTGWILVTDSEKNGTNPLPYATAGGVAYVNVWGTSYYTSYLPALVYYNNLGSGYPPYVAEAASHELGHNLGLSHDGTLSGAPYYSGHGSGYVSWAPIMGVGYYSNVTQWSKGEYPDANNQQDDIAIITGKLTERVDDHADTISPAATPLAVDGAGVVGATNPENDPANLMISNKGVVESQIDVDMFVFNSGSGTVDLRVTPAWDAFYRDSRRGANLDIQVSLYDSGGNPIASIDPSDETDASLQAIVADGVYYLAVEGVGNAANYSDYGSTGQYFINGSIPLGGQDTTAPSPDPMQFASNPQSLGPDSITMTAVTAIDDYGVVEYQFQCCLGGGTSCVDSAWQSSPQLTAQALQPGTLYDFVVRSRDLAGNQTAWSPVASATTEEPNLAPSADFTYDCNYLVCAFTDTSGDSDGTVDFRSWSFGDGNGSSAQNPSHTFADAGLYNVNLTVTDNNGATGQHLETITVESMPAPQMPGSFSVSDGQDGIAILSWLDLSESETAFEAERQFLHKNGSWRGSNTFDTGIAGDSNVQENETATDAVGSGTYRYRLRAVGAGGSSSWTSWIEVTVTEASGGGGGGNGGSGGCKGKKCR